MSPEATEAVESRKVGAEDVILVQLPAGRFRGTIPSHWHPPTDDQGRCVVMMLAQDCARCSFGAVEAGPTQELHLWLLMGTSTNDPPIEGVDLMLPSKHWLALFAATNNPEVEAHLRSFGFDPRQLASVNHEPEGGAIDLGDGDRIAWRIAGAGRGPANVGVYHEMLMPDDEPGAVGHRVAARITGAMMEQPGELHVRTAALEPFLRRGEKLRAMVHRMPKLDADVVWRRRSRGRDLTNAPHRATPTRARETR